MNKKYELNATPEQIEKLRKAIHVGSPLGIALTFSGISWTTWYYWNEIAAVVSYCKERDMIQNEKKNVKSGISFDAIQESVENARSESSMTNSKGVREPSGEAITKYRTNRTFQAFADKVFAIIQDINSLRSEIVLYHLTAIRDAARQRGTNSNATQWFLERTMPQYFGKAEKNEEQATATVKSVKIEYIDSESKDTQERIKAMEQLVEHELGGEPSKA